MKMILISALLAAPVLGSAAQDFSLDQSTNTQKAKQVLEEASDKSGEGGNAVFDGSRGHGSVSVAENVGGLFKNASAALSFHASGLKVGDIPAVISDKVGKKQGNLDNLDTAPDGTVYRMRSDHAWYKFWDTSKVIEQAVADKDGAQYNKKGEFVGDWKPVMKTRADGFKVVADKADGKATGKNAIFTFEKKGSGTEIAKDGKYITTLGGNDLREIKIGPDNKVYARYEKGKDDVIVSIDPATKAQQTVTKVAAEYKSWKEWVPETGYYTEVGHYTTRETPGYYSHHDGTPGYYDGNGYWHNGSAGYDEWHEGSSEQIWVHDYDQWHVTDPAHYETRTSRTGVTKFEVDGDGKVLTLFKGQVTDPANDNKVVSADNVQNFSVDSKGTLYTVVDNKLAVNNGQPTTPWDGSRPMLHDDHGNFVWKDGKYLRQGGVTPDPNPPAAAAAGAAGK